MVEGAEEVGEEVEARTSLLSLLRQLRLLRPFRSFQPFLQLLQPSLLILSVGSSGSDVKALQIFLNSSGFAVAATGPGSPGNETTLFGSSSRKPQSEPSRPHTALLPQAKLDRSPGAFIASFFNSKNVPTTVTPSVAVFSNEHNHICDLILCGPSTPSLTRSLYFGP